MKANIFSLFLIPCSLLLASCGEKNDFDATGTFEATEVTVSAEASGKVLTFTAEEGARVQAGEVLGVIDTMQLYLQREQLLRQQSALLRSRPDVEKQVASLRKQIDKQQREVKRVENLLAGKARAYASFSLLSGFFEASMKPFTKAFIVAESSIS